MCVRGVYSGHQARFISQPFLFPPIPSSVLSFFLCIICLLITFSLLLLPLYPFLLFFPHFPSFCLSLFIIRSVLFLIPFPISVFLPFFVYSLYYFFLHLHSLTSLLSFHLFLPPSFDPSFAVLLYIFVFLSTLPFSSLHDFSLLFLFLHVISYLIFIFSCSVHTHFCFFP